MHKMIRGIWKKGNDRNPPDGRSAEVAGTSSCSPTVTTIILTITIIIAIMMMTMIRTLWTTRQCKDLTWLLTVWLIANHSFHLLLTRCHHYHHHHAPNKRTSPFYSPVCVICFYRQVPCFGLSCPTQNLAMETCYLVDRPLDQPRLYNLYIQNLQLSNCHQIE